MFPNLFNTYVMSTLKKTKVLIPTFIIVMQISVSTGGPAIFVRILNIPPSTWWALQPFGIPTSMACLTHMIPAEGEHNFMQRYAEKI